jgi:energy-coupling factor transport system permease protein
MTIGGLFRLTGKKRGSCMAVIEYLKKKSFLHRLDPRTKIALLLLLTVVVFIVNQPFVIAGLMVSFFALWAAAKMPFVRLKSYIKFLFGLIIFITAAQIIFGPGTNYIIKPLIPESVPLIGGRGSLKWDGFLRGLIIGLRLIALIVLMPMLTMTTEINTLALGLTKLGLNYKGAYIITTAINLIPTFEDEAQVIMDAQKMRGMRAFEEGRLFDKLKAYPALAVPLVIGAMRRAQMMGIAMDARAFGAYRTKTYLENIKMSSGDYIAIAVCTVYSALALTLNFILL